MFIVLEIQSTENSSAVLSNTFVDRPTAENKYHTILAYAATSDVPVHAAVMLDEKGLLISNSYYEHEVEVEEEPIA